MKKFIIKIAILILVNIAIYNLAIYSLYNKSFLTSACTAPKDEKYDFVLMGTSHGQVFYKHIVEPIISKKMKNLASGAAGIIPQKIQLECFFQAHNKTDKVVYLLDPWILHSNRWNESNYILQQENIEYSYLVKLLENNVDSKVLFNYFRDKLIDNYDKFMRELLTPLVPIVKTKPVIQEEVKKRQNPDEEYAANEAQKREATMAQKTPEEQKVLNAAEDKQRLEILYDQGIKKEYFNKYSKELEKVILVAKKNNAQIVFIIPPTLMGKLPGHDNTIELLAQLKKTYGINYFDLSVEMQNQDFYWDREHLSRSGVEYFTQNYLKKILN